MVFYMDLYRKCDFLCEVCIKLYYDRKCREMLGIQKIVSIYYLLTGCKGRTRKYKPKVFHTARACEGCLENQGLVFLGTARAPS